jgi:hypothetical protein
VADDRPARPGWYRDPDDPARLRHWSGRSWDHRRRTLPTWAIATIDFVASDDRRAGRPTLEGPVHPAALPATATAATAQSSRRRPAVVAARPGGFAGRGGGRVTAPGGGAPGARAGGSATWPHPRAALILISAAVGVAILILSATVGGAPSATAPVTLADDSAFVAAATVACNSDIAAARLAPTPAISPKGSIGTSDPLTPTLVAEANDRLARLRTRLLALPVIAAARPGVQRWMDGWDRFAADRVRLAALVAKSGAAAASTAAVTAALRSDAGDADAFAVSNHLDACTLDEQGAGTYLPF